MKIILFSRPQVARTAEEIRLLLDAIRRFGTEYAVNEEFVPVVRQLTGGEISAEHIYGQRLAPAASERSIMVCYGGDGTLLEGVHRLGGAPVPVLGINAGHLGFLTSAPNAGLDELFRRIAAGEFATEARSLLSVTGDFAEQPDSHLALNEFTVQRHGAGMIAVETYVDNQMVATYHGDGVIVSTPTGSTAYSLSAGGPVVVPACRCLTITPLAPHNLTMRPVVIPDDSIISLRIRIRHSGAFVTLDNRTYPISQPGDFTVRRAEERIFLAVPHNISFYDTLRDKMMWGIDIRS
ncbi:NAD(+)/NADH kinase [Alistipes sp. CAG:268]|uniref:NAD(+)/NADH kinase n=1 Tax=Alistipes sp. CAG:268 TaxID=1262693 RepID=UPI00033E5DD1|nr:NAD(+)/NADH kinase [Alistipes sp. CAG:268]CDC96101.1 probable inorganic polyphosphate/ATP-NAD kinase [Alistipes sp. CAG:268]HBL71382.1 NADH kinase [Alistipes sp.]HBW01919.1 NADH kinase [Alistipes sp.]HIX97418.1 NAD(+)/NADH kinase [Candidatus Alistipes avistercoris]